MKTVRFLLSHLGGAGLVITLFLGFHLLWQCHFSPVYAQVRGEVDKTLRALPGDCSACHKDRPILPRDHTDTRGMTYKDCTGCHGQGPASLRGKVRLDHFHRLSSVGCSDCHDKNQSPGDATTEKCLSCHGSYEAVAGRTVKSDPNPHNSLHYGTTVECDLCHHQHRDSENFCSQCHEWHMLVP